MEERDYFQASVDFRPVKKPCKNFFVDTVGSRIHLKWIPGEKATTIKERELGPFFSDTEKLINYFGYDYRSKPIIEGETFTGYKMLRDYWIKWGPLFQVKGNEIELTHVIRSCWTCLLLTWAWFSNSNTDSMSSYFFDNVEAFKPSVKDVGVTLPCYWEPVSSYLESKFEPLWHPVNKRERRLPGLPKLYLPTPPENLSSREKKKQWLKGKVREYISEYVNQQKPQLTAQTKDAEFVFIGSTNNLLLAYLLNGFWRKRGFNVCPCGCGDVVCPDKKWATPQCYLRYKNNNDARKLKSWLRTKKSRGKITKEVYEKLKDDIDYYVGKDLDIERIRALINENLVSQGLLKS